MNFTYCFSWMLFSEKRIVHENGTRGAPLRLGYMFYSCDDDP